MYNRTKENNPMWGRKQTEKAKANISASQKMRYKTINEVLRSVTNGALEDKIHRIVEETIHDFISTHTLHS